MGCSSRSWFTILDLLPPDQRRAYLEIKGYPPEYKPPPLEWQGEKRERRRKRTRLEPLAEIGRIMRQRPGITGQLKDDLIERVEPEEGE